MSVPNPTHDPERGLQACESALERVANDVGLVVDRDVELTAFRSEVASARPAGEGSVHVSFRLTLQVAESLRHGAVLMPAAHASGLAGSLMMMSDHQIDGLRERETPDRATKDAMVELGTFVAGAIGDELTELTSSSVDVVAAGCQGVRDGVRPAFPYREGDGLWVVRARCAIGAWDAGDWVLVLPDLSALFTRNTAAVEAFPDEAGA